MKDYLWQEKDYEKYHQNMHRRNVEWKLSDITKQLDQLIKVIEEGQRLMLPLMGWEPPPEPIRTPLTILAPLPTKVTSALKRSGITTVEELLARSPKQLLEIRGFGSLTVANLEAQLESKGYSREAKPQP